jgi:tetratricopeptide (TPR) repeat protein
LNTEIYTNLLAHPQKIGRDEIALLSSVIEKHPYFQSARALQLKALKNDSSFLYNDALKLAAAYTTDRDILFEYITSDSFIQNKISREILSHNPAINEIEIVSEDISEAVSIEIDNQIKEELKKAEAVLSPDLFERKITSVSEIVVSIEKQGETAETETNTFEAIEAKEPAEEIAKAITLGVNEPLTFTKKDTHSFTEWLQLSRTKPIDRRIISKIETESSEDKSETSEAPNERERKNKLIEKFIQDKPKLPSKAASSNKKDNTPQPESLANLYSQTPEALMTETLARVYLQQKNYTKAIKAYKILILKYPEKSGFFADQIRAVKKLINTEE